MPNPTDTYIIPLPSDGTALARERQALITLDQQAEESTEAAVPLNTRRAYEFDLACYASWCARHGVQPIPAEPRVVRAYLQELATIGRAPEDLASGKPRGPFGYSALTRALSAICRSQRKMGHQSVWNDPLIREMRGALARLKGTAPQKQKRALDATGEALLFGVCDSMGDDLRGIRDRAMLLVGWQGGGRRRSEIAAACVEHFTPIEGGLSWRIPRSKADQTRKGLTVALTLTGDERYCSVRALRRWLTAAKIERGPVFRGIDMLTGEVMEAALAPAGVARRIQHYVGLLGLNPADFGGHSLRSGFVTTAYKLGRKIPDIMEATGHSNPNEVLTYIRRAGLVEESAARGLTDEALARRKPPQEVPVGVAAPAPGAAPEAAPAPGAAPEAAPAPGAAPEAAPAPGAAPEAAPAPGAALVLEATRPRRKKRPGAPALARRRRYRAALQVEDRCIE